MIDLSYYIMFRRRTVCGNIVTEGGPNVLTFTDFKKYTAKIESIIKDNDLVMESCGVAIHEE